MPLHITLSKLVFTSHCICFYYIMICPVSSAYTIGVVLFAWPQYIGCWLWTDHCFGYLFPALFANQILICFMSVAHASPVLSPLHLLCVEQLIVSVSLFPALLLIGHWFIQCQQHLYNRVILQYNSVSMATDFEKVTFSIRLFLIWVLYIYIIFL